MEFVTDTGILNCCECWVVESIVSDFITRNPKSPPALWGTPAYRSYVVVNSTTLYPYAFVFTHTGTKADSLQQIVSGRS